MFLLSFRRSNKYILTPIINVIISGKEYLNVFNAIRHNRSVRLYFISWIALLTAVACTSSVDESASTGIVVVTSGPETSVEEEIVAAVGSQPPPEFGYSENTGYSLPSHLEQINSLDQVLVVNEENLEGLSESVEYKQFVGNLEAEDCCIVTIELIQANADEETVVRAEKLVAEVRNRMLNTGVENEQIRMLSVSALRPCVTPPCFEETVSAEVRLEPIAPEPLELEYVWNAWAEADEGAGNEMDPVEILDINSDYYINIHLANGRYPEPGVLHVDVARRFAQLIEKQAAETRNRRLRFTPILLLDPAYFETESVVLPEVILDLKDVRRVLKSKKTGDEIEIEPFAQLESFLVRTRDVTGLASIGLSIWQEGRPVDELWFPFCIGNRNVCDTGLVTRSGLGGTVLFDSINDTIIADSVPDAALHIVELSRTQVMGVFTRKNGHDDINKYHVWKISRNADSFVRLLDDNQERFGKRTEFAAGVGKDLANGLFPQNDEGREARAEFVAFLNEVRGIPFSSRDRPTIFVRYLRDKTEPLLYPLGLLNPTGDENDFVGYHVRVETPLPIQRYQASDNCVAEWVPTIPIPSNDDSLNDARARIESRLRPPSPWDISTTLQVSRQIGAVSSHTDFGTFHEWISEDIKNKGTVLTVLSHHSRNALYFRQSEAYVSPYSVARTFTEPSAAILAGCSTGAPGAAELVGSLNQHGVDSVISTNTGISGNLAGDFMECMLEQFDGEGETVEIGPAFDGAQACLYGMKTLRGDKKLYGPQVLSFSFAGNPFLKICNRGNTL